MSKKAVGGEGAVARVSYGIAAVTRTFHGADFPADKRALMEKISGKEKIHWTKEHVVDLNEILESLPDGPIASITELTHLINGRIHHKALG